MNCSNLKHDQTLLDGFVSLLGLAVLLVLLLLQAEGGGHAVLTGLGGSGFSSVLAIFVHFFFFPTEHVIEIFLFLSSWGRSCCSLLGWGSGSRGRSSRLGSTEE